MALTLKILATGQVTPIDAALYPAAAAVQAGKSAIVKNIILTNVHLSQMAALDITVRKQNAGSTGHYISPPTTQLEPGAQVVIDTEITLFLNTGPDCIYAKATGGTVQYVINGMERDI